jgi:hypothetical protein
LFQLVFMKSSRAAKMPSTVAGLCPVDPVPQRRGNACPFRSCPMSSRVSSLVGGRLAWKTRPEKCYYLRNNIEKSGYGC